MNYNQWNRSMPGGQMTDANQTMQHWSNRDQYNAGNMAVNQYVPFQEAGAPSTDWNAGTSFQWCTSTSQGQINWSCPPYQPSPTNYNQMMQQSDFASGAYSNFPQNKSNFENNFQDPFCQMTNLPKDTNAALNPPQFNEANSNAKSVYDYGNNQYFVDSGTNAGANFNNFNKGNSYLSGNVSGEFRMNQPQVDFVSNCPEPSNATMCGNAQGSNNFPFWNANTNQSKTMDYVPHPLYSNNKSSTGNHPPPHKAPKMSDVKINTSQGKLMPPPAYDAVKSKNQQSLQVPQNDTTNTFSNSTPPNFLMRSNGTQGNMPTHPLHSSHNMQQNQNAFVNSFSNMNPSPRNVASTLSQLAGYDASATPSTSQSSDSKTKRTFTSDGAPKNSMGTQAMMDKPNSDKETVPELLHNLDRKITEMTNTFDKLRKLCAQFGDPKSNGDMNYFEMQLQALDNAVEHVEKKIQSGSSASSNMAHNGQYPNQMHVDTSVAPLRQRLQKLKMRVKSHQNSKGRNDPTYEAPPPRCPGPRYNVGHKKKNLSMRTLKRAILKYLVRLSKKVELSFSELRNIKKILSDDPKNTEVVSRLKRVSVQINQFKSSLKLKQEVCASRNIELKNLTIKATGANIMKTLESDMHNLQRFQNALSQITRHSFMIEKVGLKTGNREEDDDDELSESDSLYDIDIKDVAEDDDADVKGNCSTTEANPSDLTNAERKNKRRHNAPIKSEQFMEIEKKFWAKINESTIAIKTAILKIRQGEKAFENGDKQAIPQLQTLCDTVFKSMKNSMQVLVIQKKKYKFSRSCPAYIINSYIPEERSVYEKNTYKAALKSFEMYKQLCKKVIIRVNQACLNLDSSDPKKKEEGLFWKRIIELGKKVHGCHLNLIEVEKVLSNDPTNKESSNALTGIEENVKHVESLVKQEDSIRQANGYGDVMPTAIVASNHGFMEHKDFRVLRDNLLNLKTLLSDVKSSLQLLGVSVKTEPISRTDNDSYSNDGNHKTESDFSEFFGDGVQGWSI